MAIALPLLVTLFAPLQGAVQWLSGGSAPAAPRTAANDAHSGERDADKRHADELGTGVHALRFQSQVRPTSCAAAMQGKTGNAALRAWQGPTRATLGQRPLRVVRVVEPHVSQASAGRMVISGRMDDVCAELDRLTALEAA
ncbi:MAG: hypothetical protein V4609_07620 [Pseudomonadota bacterium]